MSNVPVSADRACGARPRTADHASKSGSLPVSGPESEQVRKLHPEDWPKELGGPTGPEPTRYGDWERKGRCSDF